MKTLQLSTFVLLLFSIFSACTKETTQPSENSFTGAQVAKSIVTADAKKPVLNGSYLVSATDNIVNEGDMVTVSYTAKDRSNGNLVNCGHITIYQLIEGVWTEVARGDAPTVSIPAFKADKTGNCAYQFRAGFDPGAGTTSEACKGAYSGVGYDDAEQEELCVSVVPDCVETFTIGSDVSAVNKGNGVFEFTVTYTLTSPVAETGVKFQGGATAGGNINHKVTALGAEGSTDLFEILHENNNNTVLIWKGDLEACTPKVLTFKYTRNFSCPAEGQLVTGDWKASVGERVLGTKEALPYSCDENDNKL
jgi:hypothetical protein